AVDRIVVVGGGLQPRGVAGVGGNGREAIPVVPSVVVVTAIGARSHADEISLGIVNVGRGGVGKDAVVGTDDRASLARGGGGIAGGIVGVRLAAEYAAGVGDGHDLRALVVAKGRG